MCRGFKSLLRYQNFKEISGCKSGADWLHLPDLSQPDPGPVFYHDRDVVPSRSRDNTMRGYFSDRATYMSTGYDA